MNLFPLPLFSVFTSDCDCDEDKKKTAATDVQMVTPSASSNSYLHRTERPATTQKTAAAPRSYDMTVNVPFTHKEPKPDDSSGYVTSADAPMVDPTLNPFLTTNKEPFVSTSVTTTTTTASKVIRGRIPWDRLFGGREREKILGRLRRPLITTKTSTTAQTTTVTLTTTPTTIPTTTANSLPEPETLSPSRYTESRESSSDDDYGDSSSADLELTTSAPSLQQLTTTSSSYHSRYSTAETPPESQTLSSPPTVKPPSIKNPDEVLSPGSGGFPDNRFVGRQRPGGARRQLGRRRRPFMGRRPFRRPGITSAYPTTTTTAVSMMESTKETTTLPEQSVSLHEPLNMPLSKENRATVTVSTDQTSKEGTDFYEEFAWSTSSRFPATTKTPFITSKYNPTTTLMPATTKEYYTTVQTRVHSNIRPPTQRNNGHITHRPPLRTVRPTVQSSFARGSVDKGLHFDTVTILTAEKGYINTPEPYDNGDAHNANPTVFYHVTEATGANSAGLEPTTQVLTSKPKIVGGNAASFTVLSNSDAFLPCEAIGNPQPDITWKRFSSSTGTKSVSEIENVSCRVNVTFKYIMQDFFA